MKEIIDLSNWKGKKHYLWFKEYAHPYYSITSTIDLTDFFHYIKACDLPFFGSFMYLIVSALNEIEEFRLRIDHGQVVLFDVIHPAFTLMTADGVFDNCDVKMAPFPVYLENLTEKINQAKKGIREDAPYNDDSRKDQYYISCLPWMDFTAATHPMTDDRNDSVPRIVWGKYHSEGDKVLISLNIQVHHALIDGYPLSRGFLKIQEYCRHPERYLK